MLLWLRKRKSASMTNLRLRASQAFDAEFRDELANAVQLALLRGLDVAAGQASCHCPLGCLLPMLTQNNRRPGSVSVRKKYTRFSYRHFRSFIGAFDAHLDDNTPEAALGLLYRERLVKCGL